MTATFTLDVLSSLDGFGAASGNWTGNWSRRFSRSAPGGYVPLPDTLAAEQPSARLRHAGTGASWPSSEPTPRRAIGAQPQWMPVRVRVVQSIVPLTSRHRRDMSTPVGVYTGPA